MARRGNPEHERDGGHHAIKGFTFQFDASLLRLLENPTAEVEVEGVQDIGVQNFHIQVKNRNEKFSLMKVGKAVRQMMAQYAVDRTAKFALYCHFSDQDSGTSLVLAPADLDRVLGAEVEEYDAETRKSFTEAFKILFAPDYERQFGDVLRLLKTALRAGSESEALYYHALIHAHLRHVVLTREQGERRVSFRDLRELVRSARSAIFEAGYAEFRGYDDYLKLLRDQYKSSSVNVPKRQRLFIVEVGLGTHIDDLVDVASTLRRRYFIGESPAPFVSFRNVDDLIKLKTALWRADIRFDDGFPFGGSGFQPDHLVDTPGGGHGLKLVDFDDIRSVTGSARFHEVHDFYLSDAVPTPDAMARTWHVSVERVLDIQKIID
ncbi:hypothetical protein [Kitasatospora sp. NPDC098663]|uniref:hypothetical protein n=1 Tax=Kitasatospora sp. NPDC098663 TaxID=3364096 RepID=UPI00382503C1